MDKDYYQYWGKASKDDNRYHLLVYHSLDVAAVGYLLLSPDKPLCKQLADQLQVAPKWLLNFFVVCLLLHDLGKFSRSFQGLCPNLSPDLVKQNKRMSYSERHDSLGYWVWIKEIRDQLSDMPSFAELSSDEIKTLLRNLDPWLEIVTGHHGMPPKKQAKRIQDHFEVEDQQAIVEYVHEVFKQFLDDFDYRPLLQKGLNIRLKNTSWQLAGVAVLADWLGSNQQYFEYFQQPQTLRNYWGKTALPAAHKVMQILPDSVSISPYSNITELFPFIKKPTPLQEYAIHEPLPDKPQLFILEDVTGAGKTEAALILVHRLMSQGLAEGLYVALPTMATANAMYQRLGKVYKQFYQDDTLPSLILSHGARNLSDSFRNSVMLSNQPVPDSNYQEGKSEDEQELSATAYCNAWLADNRKKALLADVGVGTLDQALLAVLPARHQSLRLLGLARKILLVDEVHAYDSYMQKLLNALLEAHARQGGSVILLSATLPQSMREELVKAFHKGTGEEAPELTNLNYPLVTHTPALKSIEQPVDTRQQVKRSVKVKRLDSVPAVLNQIKHAVKNGKCVCWIRNTVKSARQSYQDLLDEGIDLEQLSLFHSRFAMQDRQAIEKQTLARFGKDSKSIDRAGQVLIATQVVEQSLDLDFDLLITDLAPIDLIIQRAGRLQRHVRDKKGNRVIEIDAKDQRGIPVLYLYSPEAADDVDKNWLKPDHSGTQAVYPHIGQLWLTAKQLLSAKENKFSMPEDARKLIEAVYSGHECYPESLDQLSGRAEGEDSSRRSMADLNSIKLNKGYTRSSGDWDEETRIPTRLTEQETISVALVIENDGSLKPYAVDPHYAWALSTIKLPECEWRKAQQVIPERLKQSLETLKEENKALRWLDVFPITVETKSYYTAKDGWLSPEGNKT